MIDEDKKKVLEKLAEHLKNETQKAIEGSIKASDIASGAVAVDMSIGEDKTSYVAQFPPYFLLAPDTTVYKPIPALDYKNSTIYRNGEYTTVKWGDGTVTTVKCKEGDECDDTEAFINALANKVFGGRSALKRHVKEHTVDVAEKKRKKAEKKAKRRETEEVAEKIEQVAETLDTPTICDSKGQELREGNMVFVSMDEKYLSRIIPGSIQIFKNMNNRIWEVASVDDLLNTVLVKIDYDSYFTLPPTVCTKVKTEAPFEIGDYVIVDKPKEVFTSPSWVPEMDKLVGKPLKVTELPDSKGAFKGRHSDRVNDYWWYSVDWVRKA